MQEDSFSDGKILLVIPSSKLDATKLSQSFLMKSRIMAVLTREHYLKAVLPDKAEALTPLQPLPALSVSVPVYLDLKLRARDPTAACAKFHFAAVCYDLGNYTG